MEASSPTPVARLAGAFRSAGGVSVVVLVLGVVGAVLIVVAELSSIVRVDVLTTGTCEEIADPKVRDACDSSGFEQHGGAFILLGAAALAMAWGAGRGASRPAAMALLAIGVVVLAFALIRDVPEANETGLVGLQYEEAEANAASGLYLEIVGAGLLILGGLVRLRRPGVSPSRPDS
jgi:hypothetical protein